jgi:hypothetical protein
MLLSLRGVRSCRDEDSGAAGGLGSGEGPAAEALHCGGQQVPRDDDGQQLGIAAGLAQP